MHVLRESCSPSPLYWFRSQFLPPAHRAPALVGRAAAQSQLHTQQRSSPHRLSACHLQTRGVVTRLHDQRWRQSEVTPVICYVPGIKSQVFRTYGNNCKQLGEVKVHFPESRKSNSSVFWQQEAWGRGWLGGGQVPGGAAWVCLQLICQFQAFLHQGKVGVLSQKSLVSASSCWCSVNVKSC